MVLSVSQDAILKEQFPDTNYGTSTLLAIDSDQTYDQRSLIDFDLSGETNALTGAILSVFQTNDTLGNLTIKRVTSSWVEGSVTWNIEPSYTNTNSLSEAIDQAEDTWYHFDVTQLILDCINNTNYGLCFHTYNKTGGTYYICYFKSSENSTVAHRPYLTIYYGDKFVDITTGNDSNSGNTWALAYLTVKKGIDNLPANDNLHIAEGDYSAQAAIDLNQNMNLICEDYGGGNANPPLTVVLPVTA